MVLEIRKRPSLPVRMLAALAFSFTATSDCVLAQDQSDNRIVFFQDISWAADGESVFYSFILVKNDWSDFDPGNWSIARTWVEEAETEVIQTDAMWTGPSADGRYLFFASRRDGNQEIYRLDLESEEVSRITDHGARDAGPSPSRDGETLAFYSDREGLFEIYMGSLESIDQAKRLTFSEGNKSLNPQISPDGKKIAYYLEVGDGQDQVYVWDLEFDENIRVTFNEANNIFPSWLDNERVLVSTSVKGEGPRIYTYNVSSGETENLGIQSFFARASPVDPTMIAYAGEAPNRGIFIYSISEGTLRKIVSTDQVKSLH